MFSKWESEVEVRDIGLKKYINVEPKIIPRSSGRHQEKKFWKSKMHIVERLINKVGVAGHKGKKHWRTSGRNVGKSNMAYNMVRNCFNIIEKKTNENPIQVLVRAVENAAPRQETTVVEYGGIRHPKAVDVSPQRRIDLALRWITQGAFQSAAKSKAKIHEKLAEDIINASKNDTAAFAISRKNETERQAAASR
jgi:small subunit ribosomal protein S7